MSNIICSVLTIVGLFLTLGSCNEQPFGGAETIDRSGEFEGIDPDRWGESGDYGFGQEVPTQQYVEATPWPDATTGTPLPVDPPPQEEVPTVAPSPAPPEEPPPADPAAGELKEWEEIDASPPPGLAPPGEGGWCYSHYSARHGLEKVWFMVGEAPAPHHIYKCIAGPDGQPMWQRR